MKQANRALHPVRNATKPEPEAAAGRELHALQVDAKGIGRGIVRAKVDLKPSSCIPNRGTIDE